MFKVGDKVMLKENHRYLPGALNPTNAIGTVNEITHSTIWVKWKDVLNTYMTSDLYYPHKLGRLLAGVEDAEITE